MTFTFNEPVIQEIKRQYNKTNLPWYVGYSGGKDSSAIIKLLFLALQDIHLPSKMVTIIYCDTGVEIPVIRSLVAQTLTGLDDEAKEYKLPINIIIASPKIADRFFVKVIGRGYPPPTNIFRWCTRRLRITPVKEVIDAIPGKQGIILLWIRRGESASRDLKISNYRTNQRYYFRQSENTKITIFCPIIDYDVEEVWATLAFNQIPKCVDAKELMTIYRDVAGECPIIKEPRSSPCGKGRFGCWTCTVVSKDHAVESLVRQGHNNLKPLLAYRNWLSTIRSDQTYRCHKRRNGQLGLGPFTLDARKEMLLRLLVAQEKSGLELIHSNEVSLIHELWNADKNSVIYRRIEQ